MPDERVDVHYDLWTEKLDIQTRESTDDAFAVALRKMGLDKSSGSHVKGGTYEEGVHEVG